jgi:hypothetical protein
MKRETPYQRAHRALIGADSRGKHAEACEAVRQLLVRLAADPQTLFVRMLPEPQQTEARDYLRGLAVIAKERRAVPAVDTEAR